MTIINPFDIFVNNNKNGLLIQNNILIKKRFSIICFQRIKLLFYICHFVKIIYAIYNRKKRGNLKNQKIN